MGTNRAIIQALKALAVLVGICLWCVPEPTARAQGAPPVYGELIGRAVREFDAGNFEEARALFSRAHATYPNARTHRGLGFVEFELRNYGESIKQLEAALSSQVKPLTEELRRDTRDVLERAKGFVGRVLIVATPEPNRILVDGVPAGPAEKDALVLRVGDHVIELSLSGYAAERRRVSLKGGEEHTLRVEFSKLGEESAASHTARPASVIPPETKRWYRSPWLWGTLGAVVAGSAVATAFALSGRGQSSSTLPPSVDGL